MKTASDILMSEICNYQDECEIYGFDSYFDNDEVTKAKTLAEAERKVLEAVEPVIKWAEGLGFYAEEGCNLAPELQSLLDSVKAMTKLREEMGLQ